MNFFIKLLSKFSANAFADLIKIIACNNSVTKIIYEIHLKLHCQILDNEYSKSIKKMKLRICKDKDMKICRKQQRLTMKE